MTDIDNLTNFLLDELQKRPAMYLGEPTISKLATFISGYEMGVLISGSTKDDYYFGENGFLSWLTDYKKKDVGSFWIAPFLKEANYSQEDALWLYFQYLEKFRKGKQKTSN
ncbi:hypothetical protein [uncultured Microscilla sp.]|uniref:hypothetical protein n=1 Tax=uncultured Microscilla sp. TaxID=432653 RepID=UPI00260CE0EE|nr:hypothetical protein [uncultured Microscilla sp.]